MRNEQRVIKLWIKNTVENLQDMIENEDYTPEEIDALETTIELLQRKVKPPVKEEKKKEYVGYVEWYNYEKGFGFATVAETEERIFIHFGNIENGHHAKLQDGEKLLMEIENSSRGLTGVNIRRVGDA